MAKDTSSPEYLDLKTELRSILISSQQGCNEQQLIRDYAEYNARKEIPYRDMGYRSLIELLTSMPDVARIDQTRMPMIIHGVADQNTVHIKKLVMTQKRKKKPGNSRGGMHRNNYGNNSNYRMNVSSTYSRNRQTQHYSGTNGIPFQPYNQIANVHRNQWDTYDIQNGSILQPFTTISYPSFSVINDSIQNPNRQTPIGINKSSATTKTVASFPPKGTQTPPLILSSEIASIRATPTNDDASSIMDGDLNYSEDDELAFFDAQRASEHGEKIILLRKRIRQLLLKYSSGLWLSSVHRLYQKSFDEDLNLEEFKLKNLMAFFDCVSDFVDSQRDRLPDSTDRILLLKKNFTEATKREQQTLGRKTGSTSSLTSLKDNQNRMSTDENSLRLLTNEIDRPIVDLSSFVSLDFQYKLIELTSNEPFNGFLGDVEDPWNIRIGNIQFIPKRDRMMAQLQDHYNQSSNQSIYVIPFEQIQIYLSCVYYHTDKTYYRSFICHIDQTYNNDIVILKICLVDYGLIISDITYHINSTNLKFLHKNFSTLSTQVYDCRLANICYLPTSIQWPDDARQFIIDLCERIDFSIQIIGFIEKFYCIYLWIDQNHQQSINQLLIQRGFAIESDDSQCPEFESISPKLYYQKICIDFSIEFFLYLFRHSNINNNYIDEKLLSRQGQNNIEYNIIENNFKYFIISIEHAYYFIKHPFTKRPCLPCFEVARLLNKDETYVSQLNLIRETEFHLSDSYQTLFHELRDLMESNKCPHIHRNDDIPMIILYDLSSIRDYLCKIKFKEGDVIDAFQQEYQNYERPGYWNEKKNSYISQDNLQSHQEDLYQRRNILNFRRDQLVSLSKNSYNSSNQNEMQEIEQELKNLHQELHSMETILPSTIDNNSPIQSPPIKYKSSNNKMRETLYRIARPFDQQFALNIRFNHQLINNNNNNDDDDIEERFQDLYRIAKNVIQFFILESEISDENDRNLLNETENILPDLIQNHISLDKRFEIYNYCLQIIEYFQPIIRCYVQRTDFIDTLY